MAVKMMNRYLMRRRTMQDSDYRLLRDSYYGDGGFLTGQYIMKHVRERDQKLETRKQIAYYLNYVSPVVNSHVGPIFAKNTIREWKNTAPELFNLFMDDVDRDGTDMSQFMKSAALMSKLFGTCYIVVDNVSLKDQPERLKQAIDERACPYAYLVNPADVTEVERGYKGGITKFTYNDGEDENDRVYERTWTDSSWQVKRSGEIIDQGEHNLGRVPVIALHSRKAIRMEGISDAYIPQPSEFLSIARANLRIYNLCSELDEILRNQAFSILLYPSNDPSDLTIGVDSALGWDGVSQAPHFIAPPSSPATLIMSQIDRLVKEIYRMAMLTHTIGVSEATSGIARAWDFEKTNQALADFAGNLEESEKKIVSLFGAWLGTEIEYTCNYPKDFSITNAQQEIADTLNMLSMNLKSNFACAVKKKLARVVLANIPAKEYDAVIDELDAEAREASYGDSLENPSINSTQINVGVATGIIQLLTAVQAGEIAPEAAKIILVGTFGLSEESAIKAMEAQSSIARVEVPPEASVKEPANLTKEPIENESV